MRSMFVGVVYDLSAYTTELISYHHSTFVRVITILKVCISVDISHFG